MSQPNVTGPVLSPQTEQLAAPVLSPPTKSKADDSRYFLMVTLTMVLAFIVVASFVYTWASHSSVTTWLQAVLPVIAGLVGGVVGFYFGQQSTQGPS
jgi:hypothetical protein